MAKHAEIRPRGYYAKKLGVKPRREIHYIRVDDEVWAALGGDARAIEDALCTLAGLVTAAKARKKKRSAA